ncbi:hypothetical protein BDY17DRAFT_324115 [Neohortaea acidophila]|uniref:Mmc1 C-terminal domain-containing protein n=1 Tax=Neohortaea acidophila TaxID=245834 RepID=A0A6A6PUK2_9PEZI|nr:uncharacterized protein BDY17DRAFT_324115 [Neohortaea acidophila]KAF2483374.1 hypothetical protein BDY17DRAFT_324115 [Neohortaea acidophila]
MPPRLPLTARHLQAAIKEPYICSSCLAKSATWNGARGIARTSRQREDRDVQAKRTTPLRPRLSTTTFRVPKTASIRNYATNDSLASTTAVNAPTTVPEPYRDLYNALLALQEQASSYVDLSRLQLATRSLESNNAVIRVALLGLGSKGALAARRLAGVLLSDILSDDEPWQREILEGIEDGRSLLLRYGDAEDVPRSNALVRTMHIPSPFLRTHNMEILITGFSPGAGDVPSSDVAALEDALLVPPLTTPNSAGGRVAFVRYPVHKAVLVVDGIAGAVEYGRFPVDLTEGPFINAAICVSAPPTPSEGGVPGGRTVDVDLANQALEHFRSHKAEGAQHLQELDRSGVPALGEWMASTNPNSPADKSRSTTDLNPAVGNLISSILANASTSIAVSEDSERTLATANTVSEHQRKALQGAISRWSAEAHSDLQRNLDTALHDSNAWRRTVWWRLFWRIDDVTVSASDIIRSSWLTESEQRLAFLSGRIFDAGLATEAQLIGTPVAANHEDAQSAKPDVTAEAGTARLKAAAELERAGRLLTRLQLQPPPIPLTRGPWPQAINFSRAYMLHALVPALHRKAQTLLVSALTTIGGSAALSAWLFVATAGVYEAGAVFALGFVWSLRRLQKKWEGEREGFAAIVREDARRVLMEVEEALRGIVDGGGRVRVRGEDERSWREARGAVERCQAALEKIKAER